MSVPALSTLTTPAPPTCVLSDLRISGRTRSAVIAADQENTFFFDHPLDHVPAALLLEGVRQLVEDVPDRGIPSRITGLDLQIDRFCEFEPETRITVERDIPAGWSVSIVQGDDVVATGTVRLGRDGAGVLRPPRPDTGAAPVKPAAVHRRRADNVLIGVASGAGRYPVLVPTDEHHLRRIAPGRISASELVEAARQLSILLLHEQGAPADASFLVSAVTFELDRVLCRAETVELEPTEVDRKGGTARGAGLVLADGVVCGTVAFAGRIVPAKVYERLRAVSGVVAVHRDEPATSGTAADAGAAR